MKPRFAILLLFATGVLAAQESFEEALHRGLLALNNGDLSQARDSLESASRLKPDNPVAWAALAQTYLRSNDRQHAEDAASRAASLAGGNPAIEHALATFYTETGDFPKAAAAERIYASSNAADRQAAARAAALSLQAGDTQEAIRWAETALERSNTAELHHLLGQAYAAGNRPDDALRELKTAAAADPPVEVYFFDLGQLELRRSDFVAALATFETGCRKFPASAQLQLAFGVAAYGQRRFNDAIQAFLRVTAIDPSIEQPYLFLSRLLDQAGELLPEVTAAYAAWEKMTPESYLPPCLHAKALSAASADPAAIEAELNRSIQLNGQYWESHFELGVLRLKQREWQQAAVELARSIALNPTYAAAHFQLARAYDKLGKPDLAQAERAEHQRLTATETNVEQPGKDKPLP